jgi:hypothetical protein
MPHRFAAISYCHASIAVLNCYDFEPICCIIALPRFDAAPFCCDVRTSTVKHRTD